METMLTPEVKVMVGKEDMFSSEFEIGAATIKRFAMAVGDNNPLYWDDEFAKKTEHGGIIAPPTMIFELNHNIGSDVSEEDGGYKDILLDLLKGISNRFVRGGNDYEILQPVRPQDIITVKRKVAQIREKVGKTGPLLIVSIEITYKNQREELLGINRETIIFLPTK